MYGGKKTDMSKSHRDYTHMKKDKHPRQDMKERSAHKSKSYGGSKGDESRSHRDYMSHGS